ncbi:MAG: bifunctional (p)ppGpp synthetase/guanosine-3',5'-bis(diphosphate) 3'-pyrophosphohydrolase [Fimbriimonadia bacterium]|nr:bifunctional (p)ppGpp synthetase/guanosine-3',5'-bis(diphosphate) 3'-pyrophosphohydrolase [Fimbriimonadia bacterium]
MHSSIVYDVSKRVTLLAEGKVYLPRCQAALELAEYALQGVVREDGSPALVHSVQVAELASSLGGKEEAILTALLHDTLEDTMRDPTCVAEAIRDQFGTSILNRVKLLSKQKGSLNCPAHRAMADFQFQHTLAVAMLSDPVITLVKCCDLICNLRDLSALPFCRAFRFVGSALDFLGIIEHQSPRLGELLITEASKAGFVLLAAARSVEVS